MNLEYIKEFAVRNVDVLAMSRKGADIFSILHVPLSKFFTIVLTTGEFCSPPSVPSGKRTMTHFTEAALFGQSSGELQPRFLTGAKTFCSSSDDFDLARGEKVALGRLLDQVQKDSPGMVTQAHRRTAWNKYLTARAAEDERTFAAVIAQAKAQAAAEKLAAERANDEAAQKAAVAGEERERKLRDRMMAQHQFLYKQFQMQAFPPRMRPQLNQNPLTGSQYR